ncbi:MAG: HU family DNA-binding protein [Bacteroidetes bacterium]|nr:HU family DNA-binding protein [Bacteroidota bacterium]MCH8525307.1 HU family DNA-binding protein [Balneolales bacterium]
MDRVFEKAFMAVVRKQVLLNNTVTLEGLGSFKLEHIKQKASKSDAGNAVMTPPKDVIVFKQQKEKK